MDENKFTDNEIEAEIAAEEDTEPETEEENERSEYESCWRDCETELKNKAEEEKRQKKGPRPAAVIALILAAAVLGGIAGSGITFALLGRGGDAVSAAVSYRSSRKLDYQTVESGGKLSDADIYKANVASTVGIVSSVKTTNVWGIPTTGAASGSGFIYSSDGYIITNYHVAEGSSSINVMLYDGQSYPAELVGYDESKDVAVLKIAAENLVPVVIGDSTTLEVGDHVVAIGNPLGELTFSLTQGAVSSLDRVVTIDRSLSMQLIQTDCAINSGNSGGALFNEYGEVIGITNAKYSSSSYGASIDNIGFAIPIDHVDNIIKSIIEKGFVESPYIGVTVYTVSAEARQFGVPAGAAVKEIEEGSQAEKAGLQLQDIITEANGQPIELHTDLVFLVQQSTPGDVIELTVYRNGEILNIPVTVGVRQKSAEKAIPSE